MNNDIVGLWILKAKNDLKTGKDEFITEDPATDTICFHMQQCVEKYLKSFLIFNGVEISKTHNLALLLQQCIEIDSEFEKLRNIKADELTLYAVVTRYPDDFYMPSKEEAESAIDIAEKVKQFVSEKII